MVGTACRLTARRRALLTERGVSVLYLFGQLYFEKGVDLVVGGESSEVLPQRDVPHDQRELQHHRLLLAGYHQHHLKQSPSKTIVIAICITATSDNQILALKISYLFVVKQNHRLAISFLSKIINFFLVRF